MNTITVSKTKINKEKGVVILPLKEYQKLCESAVPTYYLKGKAAIKADKLVKDGLKEYKKGKCKTIKSLADLD
ncbi:MAG: hypothetical protein V3T98_02525 [Candidatus Paceibacterota bacterium]